MTLGQLDAYNHVHGHQEPPPPRSGRIDPPLVEVKPQMEVRPKQPELPHDDRKPATANPNFRQPEQQLAGTVYRSSGHATTVAELPPNKLGKAPTTARGKLPVKEKQRE
jgi:hypothetical protein